MSILGKLSTVNKGLRYKLMVAFSLMSVIPLLACTYAISIYAFPAMANIIDISAIIIVSLVIAVLGLVFARGLVDPVISMAMEAKMIVGGDYDRKVAIVNDDEIGVLGQSINSMTHRIKSNLNELKSYGQRMREINVDIHKKVLALSSLLQIGDIISSGSIQLDPLLSLAIEKAAAVFDGASGALYMPKNAGGDYIEKVAYNIDEGKMGGIVIKRSGGGLLERAVADQAIITVDMSTKPAKDTENFKIKYGLKNFLLIPLHSGGNGLALLIIGNGLENFKFKPDDIDLVKVFAKQMTIAIESDILNKKTEQLSVKDDLTDLYNKSFLLVRLEEEIKRAIFYQRPCSLVVFNLDGFNTFREKYGEMVSEDALKRVAKLIRENTSPVGKAARIGGDEFAILLPEKNKKEAFHIAEDIKNRIQAMDVSREGERLTASFGVSENPIDGATAEELFKKAMAAMKEAKSTGKNKVVA